MSTDELRCLEDLFAYINGSVTKLRLSKETEYVLNDIMARLGEMTMWIRLSKSLPLEDFHKLRKKRYIIYGETEESEGNFVVLGFEVACTPKQAFEKWMKKDFAKHQIEMLTDDEIQVREIAGIEDIHYFYAKNDP
jgi:hypothetical protein